MNIIPVTGDGLTMSSREIADLTGKRHPDVRRDIRNMLEVLNFDVSSFAHIYKDGSGRDQEEYRLDRELTMTLVSGYDIPLRHRVVTRLAELENSPKTQAPANLSRLQLIELAMQAEQERLALEVKATALEEKVAEQAPKVQALDRIATYSDGSFCIRDAAKNLQIQEKRLRQWLSENNWIYRRPMGAGWLAYSDKLKAGVLEHKITTGTKADGSSWTDTQVRVTAKGIAKLALVVPPDGFFLPQSSGSTQGARL